MFSRLAIVTTITLLCLTSSHSFAQSATGAHVLHGQVVDADVGRPIVDARVRTAGTSSRDTREAATNSNGEFQLTNLVSEAGEIEISRLGYTTQRAAYDVSDTSALALVIRLQGHAIALPTVEVSGLRAVERESPVAFTDLPRDEIREKYWSQDPPMLLAQTPGVYAYSDAGNGVGYSYVKI